MPKKEFVTYEFQVSSASPNIGLLVGSRSSSTSVSRAVLGRLGRLAAGKRSAPGAGRFSASLSLQSRRHNLAWQVQVRTQVLDAVIGEVPVEVPPGKLLLDVAARLERLHRLDDLQVDDGFEFGVFGRVVVLLGHHDAFLEQVLVDGDAVLFWHQHSA